MDKSYQPIASDEEHLIPDEPPVQQYLKRELIYSLSRDWKYSQSIAWLCHAIILLVACTLFAFSYFLTYGAPSNATCECRPNPTYSPATPIVKYYTTRYNITPVQEITEYVGYGPEVDQAWDYITYDVGDQMISREELDHLGLDPQSLKINDPRTGKEGYRVGMQVFHQLHCLNLLRQSTYDEYYSHHGGDIEVEPMDLRGHLDHCIEILRVSLMCQSDIGVFPFKYYDGFEGHWPDFSTLHTCRNFDDIRDWAFNNAVVFGDED